MTACPLAETCQAPCYGGKAMQLGTALSAGLPVPDGFGLADEFVAALMADDATAYSRLARICANLHGPLAVRSSAIGEDSADASFAGQHATLLNVSGFDAVVQAIKVVWHSAHSASAQSYREKVGAAQHVRIAVVLQKLVPADVAGVLFTCNPVTGADEMVIEAGWGLGEAIVQGLVIPDRFRLDRAGKVLERTPGNKHIAVRMAPDGHTRQESLAPHLARQQCLTTPQLRALHALALRCDEVFGSGPHDLEWAFHDHALYLLQRRPVTARR